MTETTVQIGAQKVSLRTSAYLPILYRMLFHRDFLREMSTLEKVRAKWLQKEAARVRAKVPTMEDAAEPEATEQEAEPETPEEAAGEMEEVESADVSEPVEDADEDEDEAEEDEASVGLLEELDLVFAARMEFAMARHADPNIPRDMEAWFAGMDDVNAVYKMLGPALEIYARDGQTAAVSKKKVKRRKGK